ncbi:MAG: pyrroloquinoline quinone biosynthesis protein PqqE [Blastocatellia bacterium]|nr:MAG: pyrroloquinoline quinone biosynthesis protein PqqE [Blastocatellia bacterium]
MSPDRPTTLLAELTYRCPLHCPYCSNPLAMVGADAELTTQEWTRVFTDARQLGVLQLGLSGGEPLARKDLEVLAAHAHQLGLYTTLVTSGVGLTYDRASALREAGLEHVQISIQDSDPASADWIAGLNASHQKAAAAEVVRELGFAFSINAVLHRANLDRIGDIIELAAALGADRLELANTQYYGWALENRTALMPTAAQVAAAQTIADEAIRRYRGRMQIIYVLPDYHETYPKPCYGGWGRVYLVVTPSGLTLPCHGATHITSLHFDNVREHPLEWIWTESPGFQAYRGDEWMSAPCRDCPRKAIDFGGCRCQAFALTGAATNTDPVCTLSPHRSIIDRAVEDARGPIDFRYRYLTLERAPTTSSGHGHAPSSH